MDIKRFHELGRISTSDPVSRASLSRKPLFSKTLTWWIEAVALAVSVSCVISAIALALGAWDVGSPEPSQSAQYATQVTASDSFEGIISDARCGAKHSAALGQSAADCTRACVHAGEKFVLVDQEKTYALDGDPNLLKKLAGERVRVSGKLNGTTISVSSAAEI
jgi:hypothetical protein